MISKEIVQGIIQSRIDEEGLFLVDITVTSLNQISVSVDGNNGVTIDQCIALSREIEQNLDREVEDYELEVSSAGLGQPLQVLKQYFKNISREVDVVLKNGQKLNGKMVDATNEGISLEITNILVVEGKKKKQLVTEIVPFKYEEIKTTKVVVSFR
jgi:ribosome maturation factor RimP